MRKFALISLFLLFQGNFLFALQDCADVEEEYRQIKEQVLSTMETWKSLSPNDPKKVFLGKGLSDLLVRGIRVENAYNECITSTKDTNNLIKTYFDLGNNYFRRDQWDKAIAQYKKIIDLDPNSYQAYYNIGSAYLNQDNQEQALEYYRHARYSAHGKRQIQESSEAIEDLEKDIQIKNNSFSEDTFSHLQYYLGALNVPAAWEKVDKNNEVVVAIIDDGININHPDLTDHIWSEPGSAYGTSKIKNFVGDEVPDNFPTGKHGTMISGIIGATANNDKGIAGIARNVKIMPLRVFDYQGNAKESNIINAMYYAINHKANIINLSLGQSQFAYSNQYDEIMKLAYDNGIIVVIASGNGDVLSYKSSGVNTSVNPLSPVCNNGGNKHYSIGVESLDQKGVRARWSNYGSCISFATPGENIFSTSISVFNKEYGVDYDTDSGTSFSAPMISGIIALGYNQFGYVSPDTIYESLNESLRLNEAGVYQVDAALYIDTLSKKQKIILEEQKNFHSTGKNVARGALSESELDLLSDADYLATLGYIERKSSNAAYGLSEKLLRQEVVALAMKLSNIYIPAEYQCRNIFLDVSSDKPNSWACRIIENAYDKGIVTSSGKYFGPEDSLSLVEAVGILLRASNIKIQQYSGGEFEPWQTNVIGTTFGLGLVESRFNFSISKKATRQDIFSITRKILELRR